MQQKAEELCIIRPSVRDRRDLCDRRVGRFQVKFRQAGCLKAGLLADEHRRAGLPIDFRRRAKSATVAVALAYGTQL